MVQAVFSLGQISSNARFFMVAYVLRRTRLRSDLVSVIEQNGDPAYFTLFYGGNPTLRFISIR